MLTVLLGTDWTANRDDVLEMLAADVRAQLPGRILLVPELISHDMERRFCAAAGDSACRYAEVLSFSRLTRRICDWAGCPLQDCLDNGGRLVAMAAAARQLHSKLKSYACVETNPEFLAGLVDAVDEFKRCCISAEDLMVASQKANGAFAQKLEELSLLLQAYDAVCAQGKRDPRDQLSWGLEVLESTDFAQSHVFYIDGFPDFTRQNMAVIAHLIRYSPNVVISLHCDKPGSQNLAFEKAGDTASKILRLSKDTGIPIEIRTVVPKQILLQPVCNRLFQGNTSVPAHCAQRIRIVQSERIQDECILAVEQVLELVQNGSRFRDISVVCADLSTYANALRMQFQMCGIPIYLAGTDDILDKSVISTVLTALDAALGGFESQEVLQYLKSTLSPLSLDDCDQLENYVITWGIQGKKWLNSWNMHPEGLTEVWTEENRLLLEKLNADRSRAMTPLAHLAEGFRKASCIREQTQALYDFLEEIHMDQQLSLLAQQMDAEGDNVSAQILNQLWDILLSALEQLYDVLGQTHWDNTTFTRLLKLLLSQYDVGTIPPVLDTVTVGSVSTMRCQQAKHVLVIGAGEGNFPTYGSTSGVLSEFERNELRKMGVPLTGGASEGLQIEFSEIYSVFNAAAETIYVSAPEGKSSFIFRRLLDMAGTIYQRQSVMGAAAVNVHAAAAFLCRQNAPEVAKSLNIQNAYLDVDQKRTHQLGTISKSAVQGLYGTKLSLSASQVDTQAECRLAYFLKYGLRAKELKEVTVDPAEFGTYVHAVLEDTARDICNLGGFREVTLAQALDIARKHSNAYTEAHFCQLDSQRIAYLFQRNSRELMMVVEELWEEFQHSSFAPVDFELAFGDDEKMPAIQIPGNHLPAQLRGYVDRVDTWTDAGRNYYRVVDYKTGKKDFDYCDVFNGLGLQMLLYLFALEKNGQEVLGNHPIPAGVQYFPARVPILSTDGELTQEEIVQQRQSQWKRKGLILADDDVINAMEDTESPTRLCCKRKKDGTLTGDIASRDQFRLLSRYVFHLLRNMVDEIAAGKIDPNPYTRGSSHNACRYCPYGSVCHAACVEDRRNYKTMTAQRFWDEIDKEMSKLG